MPSLRATQLDLDGFQPFMSAVLLKSLTTKSNRALAEALINEAGASIRTRGNTIRHVLDGPSVNRRGAFYVSCVVYSEEAPPSWDSRASSFSDKRHHVALAVVRGTRAALIASDNGMRAAMLTAIHSAKKVPRQEAFQAFVGTQARTVWLDGTHASTTVKPDKKVLMGTSLEDALDPLGDHSYQLSSVRSKVPIAGSKTLGVSPGAARVWMSRTASLSTLLGQVGALFDRLDSPPSQPTARFKFLSQPVSGTIGVHDAYELAVLPSLLFDPDPNAPPGALDRAHEWAYEAAFRVTSVPNSPNFAIDVTLGTTSLGQLDVWVAIQPSGQVTLSAGSWTPIDANLQALRDECQNYLLDTAQTKIYYDSGHTVTEGQCFEGGYTEQVADWTFKNLVGFEIGKEKPDPAGGQTLAQAVAAGGGTSLFGYVKQVMFPTGWLASDDGAGEVGDFVHVDPVSGKVTLVHVKASSKDEAARQVSVADYEVVVAQAVKNVRHLDKDNLIRALQESRNRQMAIATWRDGALVSRDDFIAIVQALPARFSREVIVLQPRLSRAEHDACVNGTATNDRVKRFQQLNALVLAGRLAAMAVGATFEIFAAQ